jgi:hypothetical protein
VAGGRRGARRELAQLTTTLVRPPWGRLRLLRGTASLRTCRRLPSACRHRRTGRRGAGDAPSGMGSRTRKPPSIDLGTCKDPKYWFWAAELAVAPVQGEAWGLSYCDGFTGPNYGAVGAWNYFPTANVRCVR